ncbi:ATP-binding protein [Pseudoalteromonas sp. SS15]|uniref:sensor histidine kinase n=1 Tax=Pseudoalteromonas sp. SS15 TaxID=3139393 RepID=UPI003BA9718D
MNKILPPLFARIYIRIVIALFVSIFTVVYIANDFLEKDELDDFYKDTSFVYSTIQAEWKKRGQKPQDYLDTLSFPLPYNHFDISWQRHDDTNNLCKDCIYLNSINGVDIYEKGHDNLAAIFMVENIGALIISDRPPLILDENHLTTPWYKDPEDILPLVLLLVILTVLAIFLYLPIFKLKKQIEYLAKINKSFGSGDLSVRANEKLQQPVKELAVNFNAMAELIENTVKKSQVFAQAVPHEMLTPLSRIQFATGLLRKNYQQEVELALLDNIDTYIDDLKDLTNKVVMLSRLSNNSNSSKQELIEEINLLAFITSRLAVLSEDGSKRVSLKCSEDHFIKCNSLHLRLVLDNLITNTLKYSKSKVVIKVVIAQGITSIFFDNDGECISKEQSQFVFLPFARLDDSRNSKTGGVGLGLAIAKAAAEQMNASLVLSESNLEGTCFEVKLPNQQKL